MFVAGIISMSLFLVFMFLVFKKEHRYQIQLAQIGDVEVTLEIADTPAKRAKGLMNRKSLDENSGMIFNFPTNGKHIFWMADTLISLDIVWLDENFKVVHIERNLPPCTESGNLQSLCKIYGPNDPARYVIELNGGWSEKNQLEVGDTIFLK